MLRKLILFLAFSTPFVVQGQNSFYKTFGGPNYDEATFVIQDSNGDFVICGDSSDNNGNGNFYLLRLNQTGSILNSKSFGDSGNEYARCVKECQDGSYIIFGNNSANGWLLKITDQWDSVWSTFLYGTIGHRYGISACVLPDSGYVLGSIDDGPVWNNPYQLSRLDKNGNNIWWPYKDIIPSTYFGGQGSSLQTTFDGGFIISGTDELNMQSQDVMSLVKTDTAGNIIWMKEFIGMNSCYGNTVIQCADSGFIIGGSTDSYGVGSFDMYIIKTNSNGDSIWAKTFGGSGGENINAIQQTSDSGFIIFGNSDSYNGDNDAIILKINFNGDSLWEKRYGGSNTEILNHGIICNVGGFAAVGYSTSTNGNDADILFIKTDSTGAIITAAQQLNKNEKDIIYPNPFTNYLRLNNKSKVHFEIFNSLGQCFLSEWLIDENIIDTQEMQPGIYFIHFSNGIISETIKIIKI
jgi:hypothetical protein